MENNVMKQFEMTRTFLLMGAEKITEEHADLIPEGFPNSLRWQLGHVYVALEQLLFLQTGEKANLPEGYGEMFSRGTSPKDWTTEPPKLDELKSNLSAQLGRLKETFQGRLEDEIPQPFKVGPYELTTIGEVLLFAIYHESEHNGCMKGLKNSIKGAS
ncbi:DinB family protein [Pseudalkalibacillus hwajinpoensis]|uniref:DinB family protein n=1 Tax=Guptibacillus hwajinpoensis TaxID=208199 RepID=A0A4U1MNI1_9BACL|nr:DinB family protein [Pseudalkalibacillus hwajinpoensis]TKD72296.1 DinB family protein [Pseudalkalibacillus hwajinpoensis]